MRCASLLLGGHSLALLLLVTASCTDNVGLSIDGALVDAAQSDASAADARPPLTSSYIKASNSGAGDGFAAVALSGDTLVVGAPYEGSSAVGVDGDQDDDSAPGAGAAYVFVRIAGVWTPQAYLKASNTDADDHFGCAIALSGDTLVVGARGEASIATGVDGDQSDDSAAGSGAAYVFVRSGATWSQEAYLKAPDTDPFVAQTSVDQFGFSVAVDGDTVVVGAVGEDSAARGVDGNPFDESAVVSGAAYVFVRSGTTWSQQAYLKASNSDSGDNFGWAVAVEGNTVVVGAPWEASNATGIDGDEANNDALASGAAYVFTRTGTTWSQQAYVKSSDTVASDFLGSALALSQDTLAVGASENDIDFIINSGAVYVFVRSGGTWTEEAALHPLPTGAQDHFGYSVALVGDLLLASAPFEDSAAVGDGGDPDNEGANDSGAAYLFRRSGSWVQERYLKASNTGATDNFGWDALGPSGGNNGVGLAADTIVVGSAGEDSAATGVGGNQADDSAPASGAVYVFR